MKEYFLPKKTLLLWRIRALLIGAILFGISLRNYYRFGFKFLLWLSIAFAILLAITEFWYLPKFFKRFKIRFLNGAVIIIRGVLIKNTHIMPYSRLIYTQTLTTPVARMLRMNALVLKAARSRIFIPEMRREDVRELISALSKEEGL